MPPKGKKRTGAAKDNGPAKKGKPEETSSEESTSEVTAGVKCSDEPNYVISSWNVNGIRAWLTKKGEDYVTETKPDMLMFQETKCGEEKIPDQIKKLEGYKSYWESTGDRSGYAGVGLLSKEAPLNVKFGMGIEKHDNEGRLITAEYEKFYLVGAYVPNSGRGLPRLGYRQEWDKDFLAYMKNLDKNKPVIYCGDLNVAHLEIDLANPNSNRNKTAGFTDQERQGFTDLLDAGFTDSFRYLYPNKTSAYSFWSYLGGARAKNVGWRLDYFVVSDRIKDKICESQIDSAVVGSDHCPITIKLAL